ncbi:unnamed protein product [Rotaria socialis]|uniref:Uncharacterized protein n=3 Tax=Rotaria socialis TaxID=392032 RepID=A0A817TEU8_9BILA|nr:unnamed protein product [Rotaria socialis]CAF3317522.1 unnamed protein product [Rotaria socialis]CAF3425209.1 unnamed protein product [Rotaria socialis]CAF3504994.1 unnamed protein product [Rotaria socialis]CAF3788532.1 unnamed protein product [Rotaria socialis]
MILIQRIIIGICFLSNIQMINSILCYQCTDCPEPFEEGYPYVTITNNTNFLAQCTKTVMNLGNGQNLVSKGSVFFCPIETTTANTRIYCCGTNYCNSSNHFNLSIFLFYLSFFIWIRTYL